VRPLAALLLLSTAGCATSLPDPLAGTFDFGTEVRSATLAHPLALASTAPLPALGRTVHLAFGPLRTERYDDRVRFFLWVGFTDWAPFTLKRARPPRVRLVADGRVLAEPAPLAVGESPPLSRPPYVTTPAAEAEQYYVLEAEDLARLAGRETLTVEIGDGPRPWLAFAAPPGATAMLDEFVARRGAERSAAR
jgi:hypothetical protein